MPLGHTESSFSWPSFPLSSVQQSWNSYKSRGFAPGLTNVAWLKSYLSSSQPSACASGPSTHWLCQKEWENSDKLSLLPAWQNILFHSLSQLMQLWCVTSFTPKHGRSWGVLDLYQVIDFWWEITPLKYLLDVFLCILFQCFIKLHCSE